MSPYDFCALENAECEAGADLYPAVPAQVRIAHAVAVFPVGAATLWNSQWHQFAEKS
jgi:hypothetical protein